MGLSGFRGRRRELWVLVDRRGKPPDEDISRQAEQLDGKEKKESREGVYCGDGGRRGHHGQHIVKGETSGFGFESLKFPKPENQRHYGLRVRDERACTNAGTSIIGRFMGL